MALSFSDTIEDFDSLNPEKDSVSALLIDDDSEDTFLFSRLLSRSKQIDFSIKTCRALDDAAALLAKCRFDVVYVDYWLGFDTSITFIHNAVRRCWPPMILITGLDTPDIRRCAYRAGVDAFLSKDNLSIQAIESVTLAVMLRLGADGPHPAIPGQKH
jgi:DNA-binding NarL/FixJ family response regulator